jgi:hypothetical protein
MAEMDTALDQYQERETGQAFTAQGPRLLKIELSEASVMAKNGSMVAYQGDVHFEHKGGGLGRLLKKAATGEQLRLMEASGTGELFLANQAMLVHVLSLQDDRTGRAGLGRRAGQARRLGGAHLRRSPGGHRLVWRRPDESEDRRPGQEPDRARLGRELPARSHGPGVGARPALGGPPRDARLSASR